MALPNGESIWKLSIGVIILIFFFCLGIAHVIYPDRIIRRSGMRKGGEMLTEFNRTGVQIVGILISLFAGGVLYDLVSGLLAK